jgi:hypothetical protein
VRDGYDAGLWGPTVVLRQPSHGHHSQTMKLLGVNDAFFFLKEEKRRNEQHKIRGIHAKQKRDVSEYLSVALYHSD